MNKKLNVLIGILAIFVFIPFINAQTCNNPGYCCQNRQCNFTITFFNQTSGGYISDGNCTLNINNINGTNYLTNGQMTNNSGGVYNYTFILNYTGDYNYVSICSLGSTIGSTSNGFTVQSPKLFLMEIYLMFDLMAFIIFLIGLRKKELLYPAIAMFMFFSLAILGGTVERIYTSDSSTSIEAMTINFSFGILSFVYMVYAYISSLKVLNKKQKFINPNSV